MLIKGLEGPECRESFYYCTIKTFSFSTSLLQEDTLLHYLAQLPKDRDFDEVVTFMLHDSKWESTTIKTNRPIIISTQTNSTVAVGSVFWRAYPEKCICFEEEMWMADGKTR